MVPRGTPLPMRHAHSPFATAQGAPCQNRVFGKARYQVAREARFRATMVVVYAREQSFIFDFQCGYPATQKFTLRIATAVIAKAIVAVSHTRCFWFFFFVKIVLVLLTAQNAKIFPPKRH